MHDRIMLNPEVDDDFFYGHLKTIAVLFDEVIVWGMMEDKWHAQGNSDADVDTAFIAGPHERPLLTPAGRDTYFDLSIPAPHGTAAFRRRIQAQAHASRTIVAAAAREPYYRYVATIANKPSWRHQIDEIGRYFLDGTQKRSETILEKLEYSQIEARKMGCLLCREDVFLANFLMDTGICGDLDTQSGNSLTSLLANDHAIEGYKILQRAIFDQPDLKATARETSIHASPALESQRDARKSEYIIKHINDLFHLNKMPWGEIRKLKHHIGPDIRKYYDLGLFFGHEDLVRKARKMDRRICLEITVEQILKEAISYGHKQILTAIPGLQYYDPTAIVAGIKTPWYRNNDNPVDQSLKVLPIFTEWFAHSLPGGAEGLPGRMVFGASNCLNSILKLDEKLAKLTRKPRMKISSMSKIVIPAIENRERNG